MNIILLSGGSGKAKNIIPFGCLMLGFFNIGRQSTYQNYYVLTIIGYIFTALSLVNGTQADRIGLNFQCLNLATLSNMICINTRFIVFNRKFFIKQKDKKKLLYTFFILLYSYNWFFKGFGGVVPYVPFAGM